MHVLLVLQQRAGQRRHRDLVVLRAQRLGRNLLGDQQLQPVEEFGGRRFLLEARQLAHAEEHRQRVGQQFLAQLREVDVDDGLHRVLVRELDVVEEATAQEGVRKLFLVVRGDDHQRPVARHDRLARFVDVELHAVELAQQVVRELDVGLVDFVDQQHRRLLRGEGLPQHAAHDVVLDVLDASVAQLRIAQPAHGVVLIQSLLCLRGRLDVPGQQRHAERAGDFLGQHRLAGAGFALDQQRPLQGEGGVDRELQVVSGDVGAGAFETGHVQCQRVSE